MRQLPCKREGKTGGDSNTQAASDEAGPLRRVREKGTSKRVGDRKRWSRVSSKDTDREEGESKTKL